ncbi:MAG: hypothetical protein R3260_00270 [Pseudomonas sp.]|nr:hypothetical protein [Pseudomonas sp.]
MNRRLKTIMTLSGEFPLNGFALPADEIGFREVLLEIERDFPACVDLIVAVICFQKVHALREKSLRVLSDLIGIMTEYREVPISVRVVAFLEAARDSLAQLMGGLFRSTEQERMILASMLSSRFSGRLPRPSEINSPVSLAEKYFMHGNDHVRPFWVLFHG